jgi:hypothetical protein
MTPVYRELPDGTRVYQGGMKYKPVPPEQRVYRKHKPPVEGWIRIDNNWYPAQIPVLPDERRVMPDTLGKDATRTKRTRRRHERQAKERRQQGDAP